LDEKRKQSSFGVGMFLAWGECIVLAIIFFIGRIAWRHPMESLGFIGAMALFALLVWVNRRFIGPKLELWDMGEIGDDYPM
jgi:energy-coupling factor transporter transmembrane protein EcfT